MKNILFGLIIIGFTGCLKSGEDTSTATCTYDACAYKAPASEIQAVQDYLTANTITATQHCSGVFYIIDNPGTGRSVTACGAIKATYVGKLTNGNIFDQGTFDRFIALSDLVGGWINTIPLIKEGGKIRLYIPPSLGYGSADRKDANGAVVIPGNSILIFDVTLDTVY